MLENEEEQERQIAIQQAQALEQEMIREMREQEQKEREARESKQNFCPLQDDYFLNDVDGNLEKLNNIIDRGIKFTFENTSSDEIDRSLEGVNVEFTINRRYYGKWKFVARPVKKVEIKQNNIDGDEQNKETEEQQLPIENKTFSNFGKSTIIIAATENNIADVIEQELKLLQFGQSKQKKIIDSTQQAHYREPIKNITPQLGQEQIFNKRTIDNENINLGNSSAILSATEQYLRASEQIEQKETKKMKKHKGFMFGGINKSKKIQFIR